MHPVIQIAAQLALEGQAPTMALVKTRLTKSLPMLEVINELKRYKAAPRQYQEQLTNESTDTQTALAIKDEATEDALSLQEQMNLLKREVSCLRLELDDLKKNTHK